MGYKIGYPESILNQTALEHMYHKVSFYDLDSSEQVNVRFEKLLDTPVDTDSKIELLLHSN